jgi:hypothetical protein
MSRTPSWIKEVGMPPELEGRADHVKRRSNRDIDRLNEYITGFMAHAYWIEDRAAVPWVLALGKIDSDGNKDPLLELLKSSVPLPREARWYLADLLERYPLKRRGQKHPAYDPSRTEIRLEFAKVAVRELVQDGWSVKDAVEKLSADRKIPESILFSHYNGTYQSIRRTKKRRPPR